MNWKEIVAQQSMRYPEMGPQDYGKLAYQSEFGPAHLISDEEAALAAIMREWREVSPGTRRPSEEIGEGLCRFYMEDVEDKTTASKVLVKLFILTAMRKTGSREGLEEKLRVLEGSPLPGMKEWIGEYRRQGCPALSHSEAYRRAYQPHYRLIRREYAKWFPVLMDIAGLLEEKDHVIVAIDGRCGSGKTTLAALMEQVFPCRVFHMDDFYLPKPRRAEHWMTVPGGNMDLERFRGEVLFPARRGERVFYRPFDCGSGNHAQGTWVEPAKLTVIEGSYSHHPDLGVDYDRKIFLTCGPEEQRRRLMEREGDYFPAFAQVWMPLEEQYIRRCGVGGEDTLVFRTDQ